MARALVLCVPFVLLAGCEATSNLRLAARILYYGWRMPPDESVLFKSTPTRALEVHVFLPPAEASGAPRVPLLLVHGGAFTHGWPEEWFPLARDLATRGRVVFVPEYRIQSVDSTFVPEALADVRDAVRWARSAAERYGAEPSLLVLGGSSAGAHLVAAAITVPSAEAPVPPMPLGLILSAAYVDSSARTESADIFQGRGAELSPSRHLRAGLPPTLMLLGGEDALLPDARAFCDALMALAVDCQLEVYPDVGHAFGLYGMRDYPAMLNTVDAALTSWTEERR